MSASFFGATSARNTAVRSATGTPNRIAANVPTIEVRITYKIPKCGSAAAGAHFVLNKISLIPTLKSAGDPFRII